MFKHLIRAALFLFFTIHLIAFDPPVDLMELDYDTFKQRNDSQILLKDGYFTVEKKFEYYGTTISYDISFKKDELNDYFIFFQRPYNKTDIFNEYYSDTLLFYAKQSDLIVFTDQFDLSESEPVFYFYINGEKPVCIYRKEDMEVGFRGFGIVYKEEEIYHRDQYPLSYYCELLNTKINYVESFVPDEIRESGIFLNDLFIRTEINLKILRKDFIDNYYMKDYVLKPNTEYEIVIDDWHNDTELKKFRILTSNFISRTFNEIIQEEYSFIYAGDEPMALLIFANDEGISEYGYNFIMREVK